MSLKALASKQQWCWWRFRVWSDYCTLTQIVSKLRHRRKWREIWLRFTGNREVNKENLLFAEAVFFYYFVYGTADGEIHEFRRRKNSQNEMFLFLNHFNDFKLVSSVRTVIQVFGGYFRQYRNKHNQTSINKAKSWSLALKFASYRNILLKNAWPCSHFYFFYFPLRRPKFTPRLFT